MSPGAWWKSGRHLRSLDWVFHGHIGRGLQRRGRTTEALKSGERVAALDFVPCHPSFCSASQRLRCIPLRCLPRSL